MFEICKEFSFSAAHSVYSQHLIRELSESTYPKCRRLPGHGHNYRVFIYLKSEKLDRAQMVTDFGHLKWFKEFLDIWFDHKLIAGMEDDAFLFMLEKLEILKGGRIVLPEISGVKPSAKLLAVDSNYEIGETEFSGIGLSELKQFRYITFSNFRTTLEGKEADFYQRFFDGISLFRGSPTSENLARLFFYVVRRKLERFNITCSGVKVMETETSSALYKG